MEGCGILMPFICEACKPAYNLAHRKRLSGDPTNMVHRPCADCRALSRTWAAAHPRASRAIGPYVPDEMMVERLIHGPDPSARKAERRAAAVILLKRGHEMTHEIATRVGLHPKTISRIAAELGLGRPRPRAEVELGACETRAELWQLLHRGHSISGAARSLGVASSTADRHVKILREIGVM